jgi:hypothetical protein
MFLAFLVFGTFWFWVVSVGMLLLIASAVEYERPGLATLMLVGTFVALGFFGDVNVLTFAVHNPVTAIVAVLGYVLVGVLWACFKWKNFLTYSVEMFDDQKRQWLSMQYRSVKNPNYDAARAKNDRNYAYNNQEYVQERLSVSEDAPAVVPDNFKADWQTHLKSLIPTMRTNKLRITTWMAYWPTSVVWYLLRDWVLKIFESVFRRFKGVFVGMRNRAYADILKELPEDFKIRD